jgi:hypothetical protein
MPKSRNIIDTFKSFFRQIHRSIGMINKSKMFAGFVVMTINIGSRFVNLRLSKSVENYLKYTFNRNLLVFCIAWMGSRDIYLAILVATIFSLFADFLFNEESKFCVLPKSYTESLVNMKPSEDDVKKALEVLKQADSKSDEEYYGGTFGASTSPVPKMQT